MKVTLKVIKLPSKWHINDFPLIWYWIIIKLSLISKWMTNSKVKLTLTQIMLLTETLNQHCFFVAVDTSKNWSPAHHNQYCGQYRPVSELKPCQNNGSPHFLSPETYSNPSLLPSHIIILGISIKYTWFPPIPIKYWRGGANSGKKNVSYSI